LRVVGFLAAVWTILQSKLVADLLFFRGRQVPPLESLTVDEDFQSDEEFDARYGAEGPVAAAQEWLRLLLEESDFLSAWELTDPDFRLCMTQRWSWKDQGHPLFNRLDAESVAKDLAERADGHFLWRPFEAMQLWEIQEGWDFYNPKTWVAASRPRPTVPNYEMVIFRDTTITETTHTFEIGIWLHSSPNGWLVAGTGTDPNEGPQMPHWPPLGR
jgi:hypothetical protein